MEAIPNAEEIARMRETTDLVLDLVNAHVTDYPEILAVELAGSIAKGTWLPGQSDIDIFLVFDAETDFDILGTITKDVGQNALKGYNPHTKYASHPYVDAEVNGIEINLVPAYDVARGKWRGATDRSLYHTRHMRRNLTEEMRNEVRRLKVFLKENGLYGAEISTSGFSGYVAEVLILEFGGFEDTLRAFATGSRRMVIGNTKMHFKTMITIIDPIDPKRNLSAAISNESMGQFVLACRRYFAKSDTRNDLIEQLAENSVIVRIPMSDRNSEVAWAQLKRLRRTTSNMLIKNGFMPLRSGVHFDEVKSTGYLVLGMESLTIGKIYARRGPNILNADAVAGFADSNSWVDDDMRVTKIVEREHTDVQEMLYHIYNSGQVFDGLREDLEAGFDIDYGRDNIDMLREMRVFAADM